MNVVATELQLPPMDASGVLFSNQPRGVHLPHVTEVIDFLHREAGLIHDNEFDDEELNAFAETGFIWETLLTAAWTKRLWTRLGEEMHLIPQREAELDGLLLTPDWRRKTDDGWRTVEAKATTRSRHKWDQRERHFTRWLMQVQAYCKLHRTLDVDLYVWWVCGTWRPPTPEVYLYELSFTRREIEDNWATILRARDRMARRK